MCVADPVPSPDLGGEWVLNPVSVCSWVSRKFWKDGVRPRSLSERAVSGEGDPAPRSSWVSPLAPTPPGGVRPASPRAGVLAGHCPVAWYLDPAVISVLGLRADGQLAAGLHGQLRHCVHETSVIPDPADKPRQAAQDRTGPGGHEGRKDAPVPQTHWHTYTSRGGSVLGVMIQGATRNTTVSVKMGDSEKSCRGGAERTGPGVQRPG